MRSSSTTPTPLWNVLRPVAIAAAWLALPLALLPAFWPGGAAAHTCDLPSMTQLVTGTGIHVGYVKVCNNQDNLTVTYETVDPWCVKKTNLHVSPDLAGIPKTFLGSPKWWAFDYIDRVDCDVPEPLDISFEDIGDGSVEFGNPVTIAARAVVENRLGDKVCLLGDTCVAWGAGTRFRPRLPATYFTYTVQEPPSATSCACDGEVTGSGVSGSEILEGLCPEGSLGDGIEWLDDGFSEGPVAEGTTVGYVVTVFEGSFVGCSAAVSGSSQDQIALPLSGADVEDCREHLRVSCGQ